MSYHTFAHLVRMKLALMREMHRAPPREHVVLRKSVAEIDILLGACEAYEDYIRRYALGTARLG